MDQSSSLKIETVDSAPGTVVLQDYQLGEGTADIVLHPQPTDDPNDPLNWKRWEKYLNFSLVILYALIVFAVIAVATPTWAPMNLELGFSYAILNDSYATGSATLCIGGLIFIPFALKYGRRPIYLASLLLQLAVSVWAANIQNVADLMLINAFNCLLGALAEVIVQMTVADVFFVHQRGNVNNIYVWISLVGSNLGPVASGYVTLGQGWRWVWWWLVIILGALLIIFFFCYEETKFTPFVTGQASTVSAIESEKQGEAPDRISGKGEKSPPPISHLSAERGRNDGELNLRPMPSTVTTGPPPRKSYVRRLKLLTPSPGSVGQFAVHSYRPLVILFTIPIVLYVAVLYGMVTAGYQIATTVVATYMPGPPYNFNASQVGLMSVAPFVGTTVGALLSAPVVDRFTLYLTRKNHGVYEPEDRLWVLLWFSPFVPAGLLMFGYGLDKGLPWPLAAVGFGVFAFGATPLCSTSLTYLTDSYTDIIGEAVVGVTFMRNAFCTAMIFAITPWIGAVGIGNFFLIFSMLTLLSILSTIIFMIWGKKLRHMSAARYTRYSAAAHDSRAANTEFPAITT